MRSTPNATSKMVAKTSATVMALDPCPLFLEVEYRRGGVVLIACVHFCRGSKAPEVRTRARDSNLWGDARPTKDLGAMQA
jgi:hypothetical protein